MKKKMEDGDLYPIIMSLEDIVLCDDRWCPPLPLLKAMGAKEGSRIAWDLRENYFFIYVMNPYLLNRIKNIDSKTADEILIEIRKLIPKNTEFEDDQYFMINDDFSNVVTITEVKSQHRIGSKQKLSDAFKCIGGKSGDFVFLEFVDNEDDGKGFKVYIMKENNINMAKIKKGDT